MAERHGFDTDNIRSDYKPLNHIINHLGQELRRIKCMTDPTRGGVATILCEIAEQQNIGMIINETMIPINNSVKAIHQILGTDPMYFAREGRLVLFVEQGYGKSICQSIRQLEEDADIIGAICEDGKKIVRLKTRIGGSKILSLLQNQIIPRIC